MGCVGLRRIEVARHAVGICHLHPFNHSRKVCARGKIKFGGKGRTVGIIRHSKRHAVVVYARITLYQAAVLLQPQCVHPRYVALGIEWFVLYARVEGAEQQRRLHEQYYAFHQSVKIVCV